MVGASIGAGVGSQAALQKYLVAVGSEENLGELMGKIGRIQAVANAVQTPVDPERIRGLNAKLGRCRNPRLEIVAAAVVVS